MMIEKVNRKRRQWSSFCLMGWFGIMLLLLTESAAKIQSFITNEDRGEQESSYPPVKLYQEENQVVMDNGLVNITISVPEGDVIGIEYNGINNLLQPNELDNRGYWDIVWQYSTGDNIISENHTSETFDKLAGTNFTVIQEDENQVELSFTITFDNSADENQLPLNIDKRFILLRGSSGFYTYGIFERLEGWPDADLVQSRTVFKLDQKLFIYMAVSDERQRIMPTSEDRENGQPLAYPEAVLLTNPSNSFLRGEVDDKYQYSCDNEQCWVHGWICSSPPTGFWMITPSVEFKTGGPVKQDLTSHVGPTVLSMFFSTHYAGGHLMVSFRDGEPWKKVFGPVFIYLNSVSEGDDPLDLWTDAKEQMLLQEESWPYNFLSSEDYPLAHQRGRVSGRLLVQDSYVNDNLITGSSAYMGLAAPGDAGSWQMENKGYQFWTRADQEGYFVIKNVRPGNYSLYGWVPGFVGHYKYEYFIIIGPGSSRRLGNVIYRPPRNGTTLWEIGIPDRTALEFFVPDPNPRLLNQLYSVEQAQKFRQYGLWDRYTELYPVEDLVFTVGENQYETDWFFAHVNRKDGNAYISTTWKIIFDLQDIDASDDYTLQLALAAACEAELQVRINDPDLRVPHFTTHLIGKDNAIARHGIHGLYWLYSVQVPGSQLQMGTNTIFLTQSRESKFGWRGVMYDYIRLEGPPTIS